MADPLKFSELTDVGDTQVDDSLPGLRDGDNVRFDIPGTGFKDSFGNYLIAWDTLGANATDYMKFTSGDSGTPSTITLISSNSDSSLDIVLKGSGVLDVIGYFTINGSTSINKIIDDDSMASASATNVATSESIVAYIASIVSSAGAAGTIARSNGSTYQPSTATFADTYAASQLLYSNGANTVQGLATANSAVLRTNASGVPAWASMTNGQLLIGNTGGTPTLATLTAGGGTTIINSPGSIEVRSSGGGYGWTEVTGTSQTMAVNNGYIANNGAQVDLTLPVGASIGDTLIIQGKGAGGWKISQNVGQKIHFGSTDTTAGTGGSLESTHRYDSIELLCITTNTNWAVLTGPQGTITVT